MNDSNNATNLPYKLLSVGEELTCYLETLSKRITFTMPFTILYVLKHLLEIIATIHHNTHVKNRLKSHIICLVSKVINRFKNNEVILDSLFNKTIKAIPSASLNIPLVYFRSTNPLDRNAFGSHSLLLVP